MLYFISELAHISQLIYVILYRSDPCGYTHHNFLSWSGDWRRTLARIALTTSRWEFRYSFEDLYTPPAQISNPGVEARAVALRELETRSR